MSTRIIIISSAYEILEGAAQSTKIFRICHKVSICSYFFAVRFIISSGFKVIEFKFVSYRCPSCFSSEVGGKSCFIE